jgi:hypothetical protein
MPWSYFDFVRELRTSGLPAVDRQVLGALALRADPAGECYPSLGLIAQDTGLHRNTVHRSVNRLVGTELAMVRGGNGRSHRYRLIHHHTGDMLHQTGDVTGLVTSPQECTDVTTEVKVTSPQECTDVTTEVNDQPKDLPKEEPKKKPKVRRPRGSRVPEDWKPSEATVLWCRKHGLKPEEISPAAEKFIDFWTARVPDGKEIKTERGWQAAFKNDIRGSKWHAAHPSYREKEVEILAPKARPAGSKQHNSGAGLEMLKRVARSEISYEQLPAAMQPAHIRAATEREIERLRGEMGDQQQLAIGGAR